LTFNGIEYLTQLQSLQLISCHGIKDQIFQSLLIIPEPIKIKSLKVIGEVPGIPMLFQKIGSYLECLELNLISDRKAFGSIIHYCDRIKYLKLDEIGYWNLSILYEIITHLNKHLKYLSVRSDNLYAIIGNKHGLEISSMILRGLGSRLPDSLQYLSLNLMINPNDLKTFLENCKHIVGLNKLLVTNSNNKDIDITFNVLKEFVKDEKVKHFAYQVSNWWLNSYNLEPNEKLKKHGDLVVNFSDFN